MKIALAQISSGSDWRANLRTVERMVLRAARRKAAAVLFPENVFYVGPFERIRGVATELERNGILERIHGLARENRIAILIGSHPEICRGSRKVFNTSVWIDERGRELARYRKIHLFDALLPSGKRYRESKYFLAGNRLITFRWRGVTIGLTICYDLRFPEQFRELARRGAEWIVVPAAFTRETGRAHWEILLRARAIENVSVILAPAQTGRATHGHSAVFNPWGVPLARTGPRPGLILAEIAARGRFPSLKK